jgi:transcription initiation factor TFIIIB Brf1 subunit/transcription initiation factor TFIIB
MGLVETIKEIKKISAMLRSKNVADREIIHYMSELHRKIDSLEIPELIGEFSNEYIS